LERRYSQFGRRMKSAEEVSFSAVLVTQKVCPEPLISQPGSGPFGLES
jgi:hypothetical protein